MPLRLIFMGTPDFSVPTLRALAGQGHDIAAVYTRAAKPGGRRGLELVASPVEREARRLGIAVHTPASLKSAEVQAAFATHKAAAAIVVAYGLILPKPILDAPSLGAFNLHASLLPRWRGAAPINRAIMAGDRETGVTVMKMDAGLDTGDIALEDSALEDSALEDSALEQRLPIGPDMTAGELHDELARLGAGLMTRAVAALERGTLRFTPQPADGVTYAAKIDKSETQVDWSRPWQAVHDHVRGLSPSPGAWCGIGGGRVKLIRTGQGAGGGLPGTVLDDRLTVACGEGAVRILELQKAGGRPMRAEEFLRGTPVRPGFALG
jgi:methionyl-tRNA formyltransferase